MSEPSDVSNSLPPFRWQPALAFALPFFLFVALTSLEAMEAVKPWYPVIYPIKLLIVAGSLWWYRSYYPKFSAKGLGLGLVAGLVGGVVWIILCEWSLEEHVLPGIVVKLAAWLNMPSLVEWVKPGQRVGFNPFETLSPTVAWLFVAVRLVGMVILVPFLEEYFWRGFLNRIIQQEDWENVPWGRYSRLSFVVVTIAFIAVHTEWTAALVWIVMINVLYGHTKSLWPCIVAHAASNAVLAYYILVHGQWHLW